MSGGEASASQLLARLDATGDLSVLRIRDSIFENSSESPNKRESDALTVTDGFDNATPASLLEDLAHYKARDLFSKLRFSYIEQVTKEKFLRSITSSPPLFIDPADNAVLEQRLAEQKASLKDQKSAVAVQIEQLQEKAKQLVARYDALHSQREELETLPAQVAQLEGEVTTLRAAEDGEMRDVDTMSREPHLNLPLNATYELLGTKEAENDALDVELEAFRQQLPERAAELGKLEAELRPLEAQKMSAVAAAREANRRRDGDGGDRGIDTLEGKARWWGACEKGLGAWLEIEG